LEITERLKVRMSNIHAFIDLAKEVGVQMKKIDLKDDFYVASLIKKLIKSYLI
jgi:hypothetical protein